MATTKEKWQEIANRGLQDKFDPDTRAKFDEAVRRGLITIPQQPRELSFVPTDEALARERAPQKEITAPAESTGIDLSPSRFIQRGLGAAKDILEPIATLATGATTGALGFGLGTLEGAVGELTGRLEPGEGEQLAQRFAQSLTTPTTTETGQDILSGIGEKLGALPPTIVPGALPFTGAPSFAGMASKNKLFGNAAKIRKQLAEGIKAGDRNMGNIAKSLDVDGKLITNPNVKKAIKLLGDGDEAYSSAINFENMNNATRKRFNNALDRLQDNKNSGDPTLVMDNRPALSVGEALETRINKLEGFRSDASKTIGKVVDGHIGQRPVNVVSARNKFIRKLRDIDVDVGLDDKGKLVADTSKTLTNINEVIDIGKINNVLDRLQSGKMTAKKAHQMKKSILARVSFDPLTPNSVKPDFEIDNAIKGLAKGLGESVNKISNKYKKANTAMSESMDALKESDRLMGRTNIGDKRAASKLGAIAKTIGTNLIKRDDVIAMTELLDEALKKRGFTPEDNIKQQVAALADLEKIFKVESAQAPFGFMSRIAQGTGEGIVSGGASLKKDAVVGIMNKFLSMNELEFNDKMKALRALSRPKRVTTK